MVNAIRCTELLPAAAFCREGTGMTPVEQALSRRIE
jgi:hypothetical protein